MPPDTGLPLFFLLSCFPFWGSSFVIVNGDAPTIVVVLLFAFKPAHFWAPSLNWVAGPLSEGFKAGPGNDSCRCAQGVLAPSSETAHKKQQSTTTSDTKQQTTRHGSKRKQTRKAAKGTKRQQMTRRLIKKPPQPGFVSASAQPTSIVCPNYWILMSPLHFLVAIQMRSMSFP